MCFSWQTCISLFTSQQTPRGSSIMQVKVCRIKSKLGTRMKCTYFFFISLMCQDFTEHKWPNSAFEFTPFLLTMKQTMCKKESRGLRAAIIIHLLCKVAFPLPCRFTFAQSRFKLLNSISSFKYNRNICGDTDWVEWTFKKKDKCFFLDLDFFRNYICVNAFHTLFV